MTTPEMATVSTARIGILQSLALLAVALIPWPVEWDRIRGMVDSARSPELNRAEREGYAAGYYEGLIRGGDGSLLQNGEPSLRLIGKPSGWVRFQEADVVRYLEEDFLQFELQPLVQRNLFGQPFSTNSFGMHDDPVMIEKPYGTVRIAVLGSSMDMGWGVRYQDTYINKLQDWLDARAIHQRPLLPRRFEVLNFAVAAYSPLQRLETLRRKVLAFHPDLVIYSATTLDVRLMEIHLCDMLRKNVDLKYEFLHEATSLAAIDDEDLRVDSEGRMPNKDRLKSKLRPYYWRLYDTTLGEIAAECRTANVPLLMVVIPRVGRADAPSLRAEPVARLKAIAAHHGLTLFDLSDTFDRVDPVKLEIAAWDDHPNALGHRRLFVALARALMKDHELSHLLLAPAKGSKTPKEAPRAWNPQPSRIGEEAGGRSKSSSGQSDDACQPETIVACDRIN
jgi:hypothetical protein